MRAISAKCEPNTEIGSKTSAPALTALSRSSTGIHAAGRAVDGFALERETQSREDRFVGDREQPVEFETARAREAIADADPIRAGIASEIVAQTHAGQDDPDVGRQRAADLADAIEQRVGKRRDEHLGEIGPDLHRDRVDADEAERQFGSPHRTAFEPLACRVAGELALPSISLRGVRENERARAEHEEERTRQRGNERQREQQSCGAAQRRRAAQRAARPGLHRARRRKRRV